MLRSGRVVSRVCAWSRGSCQLFQFGSRSSLEGLCVRTLRQPDFVRYINQFLQHVFPSGCWSSFCVSRNEFAHVHQDQNLAGSLNYTITLGAFDGGSIWVQCSQDDFPELPLVPPPDATADQALRGKVISTRRKGLTFDGHRYHCSTPWTGDRWVLTAYTSRNWSSLSEQNFIHLLAQNCTPHFTAECAGSCTGRACG